MMGIPEGMAEMAPGPELSAVLASLDPTRLHAVELIEVVAARNRQISYEQAHLLKAMRELTFAPRAVRDGEPVRDVKKNPYMDTEIAFALTWTDYAADAAVAVALSTLDRTPAVFEAMVAGSVDMTKAKIIATELADATDEHARLVVAGLLDEAERCTTAQLRDRIRRLLLRLDPDAVRKRNKRALESRWVEHSEYSNGTAAISGMYLSKDKAAAAWDYLDAIAKATKAAGGDDREIAQIRADVFADLLAGVDPAQSGAVMPAVRKGVVNLHIGLTTLACLDDYPGEVDGFGPVIADIARDAAAQMAETASWRFTVFDDEGGAVAEGPLRRRPSIPTNGPSADGGAADGVLGGAGEGEGRRGRSESGDKYRPTARQKAFVRARDQKCRTPGCRRPAVTCDLDHIMDWAYSRETSITNLIPLCRRHHRAKHKGKFQVRRTMFGIDWITPLGKHYTVLPELASPPSGVEHALSQRVQGFHGTSQLRR